MAAPAWKVTAAIDRSCCDCGHEDCEQEDCLEQKKNLGEITLTFELLGAKILVKFYNPNSISESEWLGLLGPKPSNLTFAGDSSDGHLSIYSDGEFIEFNISNLFGGARFDCRRYNETGATIVDMPVAVCRDAILTIADAARAHRVRCEL